MTPPIPIARVTAFTPATQERSALIHVECPRCYRLDRKLRVITPKRRATHLHGAGDLTHNPRGAVGSTRVSHCVRGPGFVYEIADPDGLVEVAPLETILIPRKLALHPDVVRARAALDVAGGNSVAGEPWQVERHYVPVLVTALKTKDPAAIAAVADLAEAVSSDAHA